MYTILIGLFAIVAIYQLRKLIHREPENESL